MKDIFILGSGGFAKEVYFLIDDINKQSLNPIYNLKGFVDLVDATQIKIGNKSFDIFNELDFITIHQNSNIDVAIGIGNPNVLNKIHKKYSQKFNFPNLIHPNVIGYWDSIAIGQGNIVTAGCIFTLDIEIGDLNIFNLNTTLGHDSKIGSYNVINPGVNISGGVVIGDENLIGTNSTILQYVSIGNHSILGAGALLSKNLDSNLVAVGMPAKPIKENL